MHKLTYLNYNLKNGCLVRWPEQCMPIPVYIAPCTFYSMSDLDRYNYMNMVINAFNLWESVAQGKITFTLTNNIYDSFISLEWRRVDRKSLGDCKFSFDNKDRLCSAFVSIGISDGLLHKQYADENEVYHTILHEIGHAIGLGHSNHPDDIMYTPHQYGRVNLSQRDINSIQWLYNLPLGTSAKSLNSTYSTSLKNIDDIILQISTGKVQSEFQKTLQGIKNPQRNLEEDQKKLEKMKKFELSIQDVKLPKEIADKFKKF